MDKHKLKHCKYMCKRMFSGIIALIFMISCIQLSWGVSFAAETQSDTWDGVSADTSWYTEHSSDSKFTINSAAELAGLAKLVNDGVSDFDNKDLVLGSDIDLGGDAGSEKNVWKPIGMEISVETGSGLITKKSRYFLGRFDGNGHEVKNLYVNDDINGSGLFGTVAGIAEIRNLTVSGTVISSELSTGGIIGRIPYQSEKAIISDCVNNCEVISSTSHTGGVIGYDGGADVIRCVNNGNVTVTASRSGNGVAGVVGSLASGNIQQCVNNGDVKLYRIKDAELDLNMINTGGISGLMNSSEDDANISDCYNRGSIESESEKDSAGCGGIVGKTDSSGSIKNCYSTGTVKGKVGQTGGVSGIRAESDASVYENNYYLEGIVNNSNGGISGDESSDEANKTYSKTQTELKSLAGMLGNMFTDDSENRINDGYPVLKWQLGISPDPVPEPEDGWDGKTFDTSWYDGHESETIYSIGTPEAFCGLAELVKSGINFSGKTIQLEADIDLNNKEWTPVGQQPSTISSAKDANNFAGKFDGKYHSVKNFTISQNCAGLFSILVKSAEISSLGIENAKITSTVANAYSAGGAAGIAAVLKNTSSEAPSVTNCYIGRNVTIRCEKAGAGGIAAAEAGSYSSYKKPVISGCVNYADVSGTVSGGIFAKGAPVIKNCSNMGIISGTGNSVSGYSGGILGNPENSAAEISHTYNAGTVIYSIDTASTIVKTGAICGSSEGPVFSDVYYLEGSSLEGHAAGGVLADNTTELTTEKLKTAAARLNLDQEEIWLNDESLNNGYPILSWQKDVESSAPTAQSLTIAQPPEKTVYGEGEYIDLTGMKVVMLYSDGYERVLEHYMVSPDISNMVTTGFNELKISCNGMEVVQPLTVKTAQGIRIAQSPEKTVYVTGEKFNPSGMVVELIYADGSAAQITDYTLSPNKSEQLTGNINSVKVSFGSFTTEQPVRVKTPIGIHVEQEPEKTTYLVLDYFQQAGMLVYVDFNDGTSAKTNFSCEPKQFVKEGENTKVTVTCTEYKNLPSTSFNVNVVAVEKIEITQMPSKTEYTEGEKFNKAGMTVIATFKNGETKEISSGTNGYKMSSDASKKLTRNVKEIKLTYQDCEAVCPITVKAADTGEPSLSVTKKASFKAVYKEGDFISSSDMDVKYVPGDDAAKAITLSSSDYTYEPQRVTADTKQITVSYGGFTKTLDVNVQAAESLEVTGLDGKVFYAGDCISEAGVTVSLKFSDGTNSTLRAGYTRTPDASTQVDENTKEVVFRFGEHECRVPVTIKAKTAKVTASLNPGMIDMPADIELSTATEGATIYYNTDGRRLAISKNKYTGPIHIEGDTLIQAYAVSDDGRESETVSFNYIAKVKTAPVIADKQPQIFDESIEIALMTDADNAQIYYTLDGSTPNAESELYEKPIILTKSTVVSAVAIKKGLYNSDISSFTYTKRGTTEAVEASPVAGEINMPADIMLSSKTEGAKIYYTTDGTEPSAASSLLYTEPIHITEAAVIKAVAVSDELKDSAVSEFIYTKKQSSPSGGGGGNTTPSKPDKPSDTTDGTDKSSESLFDDVVQGAWYYNAVNYVSSKGLMNGMSNRIFAPQGGVTRGMFATVIGRMAGVDVSKYTESGFKDVAEGSYYEPYVAWAKEKGIVNGISADSFAPERMISRQEMAVMIYRMKSGAASVSASEADLSGLNDREKIAAWAKDGVAFCVRNGLMQGKNGGMFDPSGKAVRAELAVLLQRLDG